MYNNFYITLYTNENDNYINNTLTYEINNFLNCIDYGCEIEVGIIFFTLFIDIFLIIIIIISKFTKKNIFLEKNYGKDIELTSLYENNKNICVKCRISINSSTTHCLICNRCVNNWDHHCYWLNSCVNDKNYIIFQLFFVSIVLFLISNFIFYGSSLYLFLSSKKLFMEKIININENTVLFYVFKIIFLFINIFILIIILYSVLFITIPLIKNFCFSSINNEKEKLKSDFFINSNVNEIINTEDNSLND